MHRSLMMALLCLVPALLGACRPAPADGANGEMLSGRILLWHSWENEADVEALGTIIEQFQTLHPSVTVITAAVPPPELRPRFERTAELGLGPDLLIGSSEWLRSLADQGILRDISHTEVMTAPYFRGALQIVSYKDGLYGLPLSLRPPAFYYNRRLVDEPARTLDELLIEARNGRNIAIDVNFQEAYWGISLFGEPIFTETGDLSNELEGLVGWLAWLQQAQQETQGIILSQDTEKLQQLFIEEQTAYYVGPYDMLDQFRAALDREEEDGRPAVGITALPQRLPEESDQQAQAGEQGAERARPLEFAESAGPLIEADILMFNHASSENQAEVALALAAFMTNVQQNTALMREANRIPANRNVRINPVIYPDVFWFSRQAYTAVTLSDHIPIEQIREPGNALYTAVLSGAQMPAVAVCEFRLKVEAIRRQTGPPDLSVCAVEEES